MLIRTNYILLFLFLILTSITFNSCTQNKTTDESGKVLQDTTPIGKRIADISIKIGKDPMNPQLFNDRAKLHLERNDVVNALLDMERVISMDTTNANFFITLADVHIV